jgi:hypothetical protein
MSKFLLNLHLQISQAMVNSKNPIFYSKRIFPPNSAYSRPAHSPSLGLPAGPSHPTPPRPKPPSPLGLSADRPAHAFGVFYRRRFPLRFTPSRDGRFLPLSPPHGPRQSVLSSPPRWPTPVKISPAPPLPRVAASRLGCP